MAAGDVILGANQYGKAECRLVRVTREDEVHHIEDLTVTSQLRGDFEACHTEGDNSRVVTTDTQKNTLYVLAKQHGVGTPEDFCLRLGRHFVDEFEWVTGGRWEAEQHGWQRIRVDGQAHDHSFVRTGQETRTTVVQIDGAATHIVSGLTDCTVLKSTGSEFHGFPRDRYTTLQETDDRILATSVTARWRYTPAAVASAIDGSFDFDAIYSSVRDTMLATFASFHSLALQQTLFAMGKAVLEAHDDLAEIRFSMPNKHHFLVDLAPFGLDNPNEVFFAADRPYGLIEATVEREGVDPAPAAWASVAGFL